MKKLKGQIEGLAVETGHTVEKHKTLKPYLNFAFVEDSYTTVF